MIIFKKTYYSFERSDDLKKEKKKLIEIKTYCLWERSDNLNKKK
jgi:hypothetical protein